MTYTQLSLFDYTPPQAEEKKKYEIPQFVVNAIARVKARGYDPRNTTLVQASVKFWDKDFETDKWIAVNKPLFELYIVTNGKDFAVRESNPVE